MLSYTCPILTLSKHLMLFATKLRNLFFIKNLQIRGAVTICIKNG